MTPKIGILIVITFMLANLSIGLTVLYKTIKGKGNSER